MGGFTWTVLSVVGDLGGFNTLTVFDAAGDHGGFNTLNVLAAIGDHGGWFNTSTIRCSRCPCGGG